MYLGKEDHQNVVYNMALITLMLLLKKTLFSSSFSNFI